MKPLMSIFAVVLLCLITGWYLTWDGDSEDISSEKETTVVDVKNPIEEKHSDKESVTESQIDRTYKIKQYTVKKSKSPNFGTDADDTLTSEPLNIGLSKDEEEYNKLMKLKVEAVKQCKVKSKARYSFHCQKDHKHFSSGSRFKLS